MSPDLDSSIQTAAGTCPSRRWQRESMELPQSRFVVAAIVRRTRYPCGGAVWYVDGVSRDTRRIKAADLQKRSLPSCPHRPPCPGCPRFGEPGIAAVSRSALGELAHIHRLPEVPVISGKTTGFRLRAR